MPEPRSAEEWGLVDQKMVPGFVTPPKPFLEILNCGCWVVWLAQGPAVILCAVHHHGVLGLVRGVAEGG